MFLRRSPAPRRMRSRSALKSSLPRYCPNVSVSPRRTRGSRRRSVMNSAELLFRFLSLLSATLDPPLRVRHALYRAVRVPRRALFNRVRHRLSCGPLHVLDEHAPVRARTSHIRELYAQLVSLAPGSIGGVQLPIIRIFGLPVFPFGHARIQNIAFLVEYLLDNVSGLVSPPPYDPAQLVYVLLFDLHASKGTRGLLALYFTGLSKSVPCHVCHVPGLVPGSLHGPTYLIVGLVERAASRSLRLIGYLIAYVAGSLFRFADLACCILRPLGDTVHVLLDHPVKDLWVRVDGS